MKRLVLIFALIMSLQALFSQDTEVLKVIDNKVQINGDLEVDGVIKDLMGLLIPVGSIMPFAGNTAPDGWLLCDGSEISRTEYSALFTIINTAYGEGDLSSSFNIPDFRGVFLRGAGQNNTMNKADGTPYDGDVIGSEIDDQLQGHGHSIDHGHSGSTNTTGSHSHGYSQGWSRSDTSDGGAMGNEGFINSSTSSAGNHSHSVTILSSTIDSQAADVNVGTNGTPRTGNETAPASISVNYIIKY